SVIFLAASGYSLVTMAHTPLLAKSAARTDTRTWQLSGMKFIAAGLPVASSAYPMPPPTRPTTMKAAATRPTILNGKPPRLRGGSPPKPAAGAGAAAGLLIGMVKVVLHALHRVDRPATVSGTEYPLAQPGQLKVIGMVQQPHGVRGPDSNPGTSGA